MSLTYPLARAGFATVARTRTPCVAGTLRCTSRDRQGAVILGGRRPRSLTVGASKTIPVELGPEGVEPSSGPYKEPALAVELRAGRKAGGIRTPTLPLKAAALPLRHGPEGRAGRSGFNGYRRTILFLHHTVSSP